LEVLIATFILALVIILINFSSKQFYTMQGKLQKIENIYLSTLSLKDQLEHTPLTADMNVSGEINGLEYQYTVKQVAVSSNYRYNLDFVEGDKLGLFQLQLQRVDLQLAGRNYEFFITKSQ